MRLIHVSQNPRNKSQTYEWYCILKRNFVEFAKKSGAQKMNENQMVLNGIFHSYVHLKSVHRIKCNALIKT